MSQHAPTVQEINDAIIAQLQTAFGQIIPLLPRSFIRVIAKALAGVFVVLYKYAGFTALQMFVTTASSKDTVINGVTVNPLREWGRLIGVGDPVASVAAELTVTITVDTQGGTLPTNTQMVGALNGVLYLTLGAVSLNAATVVATVRAVSDPAGGSGAGAVGNLSPGDVISFINPIADVSREAAVLAQTVTGADGDTTEEYRTKVIDRFKKRPQGGAYADYAIWGGGEAGIINVYPYTSICPGQVDVYVEASPDPDGIPTNAQLQAVLDAIELDNAGLASRRPANALVNAFPITRSGFDVQISGLNVSNIVKVQADITEALTNYFLAREPFIVGLSVLPRTDRITTTGAAGIVEDVVTANGGVFGGAVVSQLGVPTLTYSLGAGEKAKLLTATFV